jgi:hypothetical protein
MTKPKLRLALALAGCLAAVSAETAHAIVINGSPTGLAAPQNTVTFDELGNLQNQVINNQFAAFGATFENTWWDNATLGQAGATGFSGGDLVSGAVGGVLDNGGIAIHFVNAVTAAAVATVDQDATFTISAHLGGNLVEQFQTLIGTSPCSGFMGFQNILFDELRFIPVPNGDSALSIDSLQFNSASQGVPDSGSSATLLALVLALTGFSQIRRGAAAGR